MARIFGGRETYRRIYSGIGKAFEGSQTLHFRSDGDGSASLDIIAAPLLLPSTMNSEADILLVGFGGSAPAPVSGAAAACNYVHLMCTFFDLI